MNWIRVRRPVLLLAAVTIVCAIGAAIAAGGFIIGRRLPPGSVDRLRQSLGFTPPPVWREFARTDLPRYESGRIAIGNTVYLLGGFWTLDPYPKPKATARVDALDVTRGTWQRMKDMPVALTHAPPAAVDGTVWLAGGFEGDHPGPATARVWRWEPDTDTWTPGPSLPAPRGGGALVAMGSTLHYFGGFHPDRSTNSADHWQLTIGDTAWQPRAPLLNPRGHLIGIALDGWIYAISGNFGHDPVPMDVTFAERYSPAADRWETITRPPFPVSHNEASTFVHDGRLLTVAGRANSEGRGDQDDLLSFNPTSGLWSHLGRIPEPLLGAAAFAVGNSVVVGLGTLSGNDPVNPVFWQLDLRNAWRPADPLPEAMGEVAGGVIDGSFYLLGEGSNRTLRYDLASGTWDKSGGVRPAMGHHHAAEVWDERLWLFGGLERNSPGLVQIYTPQTRQWELGPSMPFRAGSSASALINGRFYVAGGIADQKTTGEAAMLDPATMKWTSIAPMPRPRNHAASGTDGERLFVFGGRGPGSGDDNVVANGFDDVQIYDPVSNTWRVSDGTAGAPLPLPQARGGMGKAVWLDGEFWVFGGETKTGAGATRDKVYVRTDIYNPQTNRWRAGPPLRTARHGIFPVAHDGQILVAGGGDVAGFSRTTTVEMIWPKREP